MSPFRKALFVSGVVSFAVLGAVSAMAEGQKEQGWFFSRAATYPVYDTLDAGADPKTETAAEIAATSQDGRFVVFTDSPGEALVFLDIAFPASPDPAGRTQLAGEPTSVAVAGGMALAGVNTSESYVKPSGHLAVVDMKTREIVQICDVGGQPDSVAVSPDGKFVAIAIENERDEDLNDGVIPQMPAGYLAVFELDGKHMVDNCKSVDKVGLSSLAKVAPSDPEPEFVDINSDNIAVITLQENNHIALIDLKRGKVIEHFSAGVSSAKAIPAKKARLSDGTGAIHDEPREPDAVAWIDNARFVTANEGDYEGGSRGFTIWSKDGNVLYDSGALMEVLAMKHGHYPAKRAHKKGTEPEGVAVGEFGGERFIFVNSERANFVAAFRDTGGAPQFMQFLPTHVKPEGLLPIGKRGLFVVANEEDSAKDKVRAALSIYRFGAHAAEYPTLVSTIDRDTRAPIGWGALSGMVGDPKLDDIVYAVSDSFYDKARIFAIDASGSVAKIVSHVDLFGGTAKRYDLEGIAMRGQGGFWLSSEGHPKKKMKHYLLQVEASGEVEQEIELPKALVENAVRFSLEGVAEYRSGGLDRVIVAFQRSWKDDPKNMAKLGIYTPKTKSWAFVHYPLDTPRSPAGGWVGLSEITHVKGEEFLLLERDNQSGPDAAIKQVTRISLKDVKPAPLGGTLPVVNKTVVMDLLPQMSATNGWTPDKVEGLAITKGGRVLAVTDNDGVDDASGDTLFMDLGSINELM